MSSNQQSALAALRQASPIVNRLEQSRDSEDRAADILELWQGTETSLRALMGGASLSGQALIRELRQQELISLGQAYALLEFLSARDRANRTTYRATDNDVAVAREGYRQLEAALAAGISTSQGAVFPPQLADTTAFRTPLPGGTAAAAASPAAAGAAGRSVPLPPPGSIATEEPPGRFGSFRQAVPRQFWYIVAVLVLLAAAAVAFFVWSSADDPNRQLEDAISLMQTGRSEAARGEFSRIARDHPDLAAPHVFLARLARQEGDVMGARRELETAIRLEPNNFQAQREMGLILFSTGNYEVARRFFVRALQANPDDRSSQGYLGCTLARLNRIEEAQRFLSRAGPGVWSTCIAQPPL